MAHTQTSPPPLPTAAPVDLSIAASPGTRTGLLILASITVLLGVGWYFLVSSAVTSGARAQTEAQVVHAELLLQQQQDEVQLRLRTESQLMSEDPRLKSTLATPGMDEATVVDILTDLRGQTSAQLLAVLTPAARVQSEVGADYLRGLDLSSSQVIKTAQGSPDPVSGTWVVADRVLDVSAKAVRFGNQLVAYLVVGAPITEATFNRIYQVTHAGAALIVAGKVVLSHPADGVFPTPFQQLAAEPASFEAQWMTLAGNPFVARLADVKSSGGRAKVALLAPARDALEPYERVQYLAWIPMLAAIGFAAAAVFRGRLFR